MDDLFCVEYYRKKIANLKDFETNLNDEKKHNVYFSQLSGINLIKLVNVNFIDFIKCINVVITNKENINSHICTNINDDHLEFYKKCQDFTKIKKEYYNNNNSLLMKFLNFSISDCNYIQILNV